MTSKRKYAIKAKPTSYNQINFRSRLEARWAVFFDVIELPWEYEPKNLFGMQDMYYQPDFLLPTINAIVEVKPSQFLESETAKLTDACDLTGRVGLKLVGPPKGTERYEIYLPEDYVWKYLPEDYVWTMLSFKDSPNSSLATTTAAEAFEPKAGQRKKHE